MWKIDLSRRKGLFLPLEDMCVMYFKRRDGAEDLYSNITNYVSWE